MLTNTIVAGNQSHHGSGDIAGSVSGSNNLIGTGNFGGLVNGIDGNIVGVADPLLGPLGDYGGPTQTMPLLPGSPAIDAGSSGAGIPDTDQRGVGRVGGVDIGAFESQGFTLTAVPGSTPQTASIGTAFATPLAVTVTANNPVEPVDGGVVSFTNTTPWRLGDPVAPLGRHRRRPGRHRRRAQQCGRQLRRGRVGHGLILRLVRPDQHGPGLRQPGREYDERFALPGRGPPEPARGRHVRQPRLLGEFEHHLRSDRLRQRRRRSPWPAPSSS